MGCKYWYSSSPLNSRIGPSYSQYVIDPSQASDYSELPHSTPSIFVLGIG
jgi:hypothetical protein